MSIPGDPRGYYRFPAIAGDRIVFVCEDDLWSVSAGGGPAIRLTVSFGECSFPRISPDGSTLSFVSTDEGQPEVYVMPVDGGKPRRLTFLGATIAMTLAWSPDGKEIAFAANPGAWYPNETRLFLVDAESGAIRALPFGHAKSVSFGPSGALAIGRNMVDQARWKRYRGGTSGEIWVGSATDSASFTRIDLPEGNPAWPMWIGGRIYFLADHEGIGNLYSCTPDGEDLRRHTNETEYYARFPSSNGSRIVYARGGDVVCYDVASDTAREIPIETRSAAPQTARRFEAASESLEHVAVHHDGTRLGIVARGQPFTMPLFEGAPVHHGIGSRSRYRLVEWLSDGTHFVCVTDRNGYEQLEVHDEDGASQPRLVSAGDIGRITELAASPTHDVVALANHRHELCLFDLDDGSIRIIDKSPAGRIEDLAFSPDGRFLAYVWSPAVGTSIIRVAKVKSGRIHDVTAALREDRSPAWDPQGRYLHFISTRDFNPVYDALQFDLSFPQAHRPFVVPLQRDVPSPFVPKPHPVHRDQTHREREKESDEKPVHVTIDFDGITGRVLAFPVEPGDYRQIVAARERALFTRFPLRGIRTLEERGDEEPEDDGALLAYDFEQQRTATIAREVGEIRMGADGRTLLYRSRERWRAIDALDELPEDGDEPPKPSPEPGRKSGYVDLDRAQIEIVPRDEWAQMFREAWRLQTEQFWVEDMSDIDWDRVYDRYRSVLEKVRTRIELSDLIWEMHGELGTSHAYEWGGDFREPPSYKRGFLGADLVWDENEGAYRVARIFRGDSWNREGDSPLAEPGLDLEAGDFIVAIGGKRLSRETTPDQRLVNAAGKEVALAVRRGRAAERNVLVKALRSESALRYRAWVEEKRAYVHDRSSGRVGYVHIPDMGPWGFAEFHRGYLSEFDREGLIVDVRYNRGGHVSPLLLEKLARKRVGYDVPRYGSQLPYPPESVAGPLVAITNQFAGSDGDIFSHAFKLYKLGPLVGKRTWGGVIGIAPYHRLVDGTLTTQPEYSFWFIDAGWRIENRGAQPDHEVDIAPHDYRDGRDPQLDKALELMEELLANAHAIRPDLSTRPSLPLP
jgi:tricorn protease